MAESKDYKEYLVYPDKWEPPASATPESLKPTLLQVETFMKSVVSTPMDKQKLIELAIKQLACNDWDAIKGLIEEVEKKWHPAKYAVAEATPMEEGLEDGEMVKGI